MNALQKVNYKSAFKYTWPLYVVSTLAISFFLYFIFGVVHRIPNYKTLTLFVSGEVTNRNTFKSELLDRYKDNELKSISCIESNITDTNYNTKLSVAGYNTADVLIIPKSNLDNLNVSAFGLELTDEIVKDYFPKSSFYSQDGVRYGIKIDEQMSKTYMSLPEECYMVLNGSSVNIGKYSYEQIEEHNLALLFARDWSANE